MDSLTFIAKLAEFLAWPMACVVVVLLLRKDIQRLLGLVRRFKAGPVEAEFEQGVAELAKAEPLPSARSPSETPVASIASDGGAGAELAARKLELVELAQVSPRSAVLEAWRDVEAAALRAIERNAVFVPEKESSSPQASIRAIAKARLLDPEWVGRYHELRQLRNKAAHESNFNPDLESAGAYVEITSRLRARLDSAKS